MLVTMTERGQSAYRAASERQARWADVLAAGLSSKDIEAASVLLRELQRRLDPSTLITATVRSGKKEI
jgi:DNA-binding MarR family transcriptional regulator